ncbi:type VI secretion system tube protein TssD [Pantoea sp. RRHST58]|uniref:type VI secretion system tube protein TssD n=1 Tax=Pantoea sp. RRHST58 TaxID=3425183 RepID=UPI003DA05569
MALPIYLWVYDEEEKLLKGGVEVNGRQGSIEIMGMQHDIALPTNNMNGAIAGAHQHEAYTFEKEIDSSSPLLYRALTTGRTLAKAIFRYYRISHNGFEEEYFRVVLDSVKVCHIIPIMFDTKDRDFASYGHIEHVGFHYKKIYWNYLDGNIQHVDGWK